MELETFRKKLDGLDDQILSLFQERMKTVAEIAAVKRESGTAVRNTSREREILARVTTDQDPPMDVYTKVLFSTLFDLSRSYQTRLNAKESRLSQQIEQALATTPKLFPQKGTIACQGVEGAYSQIACDRLFPLGNILYFKNFDGVFSAVEQGLCEYGILPIENSSHGTVGEVYDLMRHYRFHIVRGISVQVNHNLLAKPGVSLADIREVISHEQALGQCSEFLKSHPAIKVTVCENTAMAAQYVAESGRTDVAAISSRGCADRYGLSVVTDHIQNNDNNHTRFICIAKDLEIYPGANRISLMLALPHTPGALYTLLSKCSALGVNLTKLESRPIPGRDFEFLFYLDMEASVYSPDVVALLSELSEGPEQFVFLGNYLDQ